MSRTLVIGDIHGCLAELEALIATAGLDPDDRLISVGDVVDRGPDPGGVIDLLRERPNTVVLMGNHERKHVRGLMSLSQRVTRIQLGDRYAGDVAWMSSLPYWYEDATVRVVHFGLFPGVPLADTPEDVLSGTTAGCRKLDERFAGEPWWASYADDVPVCFGHAVFAEPLVWRDRVYGLDTGACHGGPLTGLLLPERRLVSVPAARDWWEVVRARHQVDVVRETDWTVATFERIDRESGRRRDPEIDAAVWDRLAGWATQLADARPGLYQRLEAELARLGTGDAAGRAAATHPAAAWLHRLRAGKLSPDHAGCATPGDVLRLAAALDVALPAAPWGR